MRQGHNFIDGHNRTFQEKKIEVIKGIDQHYLFVFIYSMKNEATEEHRPFAVTAIKISEWMINVMMEKINK